jgi:hypothetical protein
MAAGFAEESGLVPIWWEPSGPASAGRVPIDALPSVRTDTAGRFTIGIPFATEHPPSRFGHRDARQLPELLAHRDGHVPRGACARTSVPEAATSATS